MNWKPLSKEFELEAWVRLVPHVGHKEFKGSFESTTEFSTGCVRCNLEKLTKGPTTRTRLHNTVQETLVSMKRQCANPMHSYDAGECVDVRIIEYWIDELEAALTGPTIREVCEWRDDA